MTITPPTTPTDHPDRHIACQEAIEAAFLALADEAQAAGWSEAEVAAALVDLADNHLLAIEANEDLESLLKRIGK